jgi:hypothetical protein
MKNVTLSADDDLIEKARSVAHSRHTTLNAAFREWLAQFAASDGEAAAMRYRELMKDLRHIHSGGPYTRDEMNER